ncbi:50S ribosomal protein L29 [Candidatus Campbellbacteria bacterium CG22_combo_CG10-13_8_21_14_all_43_18]|uniref:Large ribosomal subunit protein uL29 n=1 Tax=Candidatus Campbellbacteria bacterium CG22_combo_CG10-13_8_21_14_all_43_18 TaxID=1974530 RepID=A0A2H0DWG4_9BACT|nr:MAG: 50S ribosomal protein L29 [Candidatus Campbellbacteria bacterium CG22_combo_CG10-13_8_21_14_all_43_18]
MKEFNMKNKDLQKKKEADLGKLLKEKRQSLQNFRFSLSGSKTRNTKEGRALRKDIARILTVMNERKRETKVSSS